MYRMDSLREDEIIEVVIITLISMCVTLIGVIHHIFLRITKSLSQYTEISRRRNIEKILYNDTFSTAFVRMDKRTFYTLVDILKSRSFLSDTRHVSVEEHVSMFLHTLGHCQKNRIISLFFERSGETVSRYFGKVLKVVGQLKDTFIHPPDGEIQLQDCVGAKDGTHLPVRVPADMVTRFRGRYHDPTQNVMAVVKFNLLFSYVLAGWEGLANDSMVLQNVLERPNDLRVPEGKYFLGDTGYATRPGFISPYRGARYHLKEFSVDRPPANHRELFNLCPGAGRDCYRVLQSPQPYYRDE